MNILSVVAQVRKLFCSRDRSAIISALVAIDSWRYISMLYVCMYVCKRIRSNVVILGCQLGLRFIGLVYRTGAIFL